MAYVFRDKSTLNRKQLIRRHRGHIAILGIVLVMLQLIATLLFSFEIIELNILPANYLIGLLVILGLLWLYSFTSQFNRAHILGKFLAILLTVVMSFGFFASDKVNATFNKISGNIITTSDVIDIVVLAEDSAASISDTVGYTYGYNENVEGSLIKKAIDKIQTDDACTIASKGYSNWGDLINKLYENSEIKVIAVSTGLKSSLNEDYDGFNEKTKVIDSVRITKQVTISKGSVVAKNAPFIVYISGSDSYGSIADKGRSDVNLLAVINPETRQVLLLSTPRDYYVTIQRLMEDGSVVSGKDKLTHAGNSGIEYSMKALNDLYGIDINYYYKINFTGCVNVINALGGITINSSVAFTNGWEASEKTYKFVVGANECDGEKTLAFVRERKAFADGDIQRGKNQEAAITGIIEKATSPAILANYASVLDAVGDMVLTNMPTEVMTNLIKSQLSDSTAWNVQSYSVGYTTSGSMYCELYGNYASCLTPDYDDINTAIKLINKIENDEIFDVDEFVKSAN
jgi:LCP family protein required for cell wall assembly